MTRNVMSLKPLPLQKMKRIPVDIVKKYIAQNLLHNLTTLRFEPGGSNGKCYHRVIERLKKCYRFGHYVIAAGDELAAETHDPIFPSVAQPAHQL